MITTADAIKVITLVAACHPRTAPRTNDRDSVLAMAGTWAELFNHHHLAMPDLLAAVKKRATTEPDAPAPAELIAVARGIRQTRSEGTGPTPEYEALCESKSEDAAELAANRAARAGAPKLERPDLAHIVGGLATWKAIDHA